MIRNMLTRRIEQRTAALLIGACAATLAVAIAPPGLASAPSRATYPKAGVILWSKVAAHSRPSRKAAVLRVFPQFRGDFRPTTLLVVGGLTDARNARWLEVSVPMRPNGRTGWVEASAVQTHPVRRIIVIDVSARTLRIREDAKIRFETRVAVGRPGMETPTGDFYVTAAYRPRERFLGAYAFETSAYSKLSEWPGGGVVGLHGTSAPWLLGKAVTHGCVRMSNAAALVLKRLARAGTPVRIVP
jgi:lipoprotein-anchoring transpeptidase ErfK/SrfK